MFLNDVDGPTDLVNAEPVEVGGTGATAPDSVVAVVLAADDVVGGAIVVVGALDKARVEEIAPGAIEQRAIV